MFWSYSHSNEIVHENKKLLFWYHWFICSFHWNNNKYFHFLWKCLNCFKEYLVVLEKKKNNTFSSIRASLHLRTLEFRAHQGMFGAILPGGLTTKPVCFRAARLCLPTAVMFVSLVFKLLGALFCSSSIELGEWMSYISENPSHVMVPGSISQRLS